MTSFSGTASYISKLAGRPITFALASLSIIVWALLGPFFGWSDGHQLFINTATTIVTFLLVFLIQSTQNRDSAAMQAKLDELIRTSKASNRFIGLDRLTDEDIETLRKRCQQQARIPSE